MKLKNIDALADQIVSVLVVLPNNTHLHKLWSCGDQWVELSCCTQESQAIHHTFTFPWRSVMYFIFQRKFYVKTSIPTSHGLGLKKTEQLFGVCKLFLCFTWLQFPTLHRTQGLSLLQVSTVAGFGRLRHKLSRTSKMRLLDTRCLHEISRVFVPGSHEVLHLLHSDGSQLKDIIASGNK